MCELSCKLTIAGGNITLEDLEGYYSEMEEPLEFRLNNGNFTLMSPQPPSGGIVVGHILKILDGEPGISDEISIKVIIVYLRSCPGTACPYTLIHSSFPIEECLVEFSLQ